MQRIKEKLDEDYQETEKKMEKCTMPLHDKDEVGSKMQSIDAEIERLEKATEKLCDDRLDLGKKLD